MPGVPGPDAHSEGTVRNLPLPAHVLSAEGTILDVNEAWVSALGYEPEAVLGEPLASLIVGERRPANTSDPVDAGEGSSLRLRHAEGHSVAVEYWERSEGHGERSPRRHGQFVEVDERRAPEGSHRETEDRYRTLIERSGDGIVVLQDGVIEMANAELATLLGERDAATVEGDPFLEYVAPTDRDLVRNRYRARLSGGDPPSRYEIEIDTAEGERVPIDVTTSTVTRNGKPAVLAFLRDVSEQRRHKQALERFKEATEAAGQAIYITDVDGSIEYVNPAFEEITGYSEADVLGETPRILKSGEMSPEFYADLWETILDGEVWEAEFTNRRKDGSIYHVQQTISPIVEEGEIEAFVAIQADVTDRLERERTLKERSERLELALDGAELGVWDMDLDNGTVTRDDRWVTQLGYDSTVTVTASREELLHPDDRARHRAAFQDHVEGEADYYECEYRLRTADGAWKWLRNVGKVVERGPDGTPLRAVGIHQDIDEQHRTRQRLKRNNELLQAIDRILRHNLNNDMTVVRGYARTIADRADGELKAQAETIVEVADRLLETAAKERQITRLLTEPKEPAHIDIVAKIEWVVDRLTSRHPGVEIGLDLPDRAPVIATPSIEQAIEELLTNTIVHAEDDHPAPRVSVETDGDTVRIHVLDSGPGIPAVERELLTGGKEMTPLYHGSGLGLWFVNLVVDQSDGTLSFTENDPQGSVVTIELPSG